MNSSIIYMLARERQAELLRASSLRSRRKFEATAVAASRFVGRDAPLTIRRSTNADRAAIRAVARLDSQRPPDGPFLVAELDEEIVAALELEAGIVIANPFRHTADAVAHLRMRAEQLASGPVAVTRPGRAMQVRRPVAEPD